MSAPIVYSTFRHPVWKHFKKQGLGTDEQAYFDWWQRTLLWGKKNKPLLDVNIAWGGCASLFLWKYRPIEHYFLADGLCDFLVSSVKEFTLDYCRKLPCAARDPKDVPPIGGSVEIAPDSAAHPMRMYRQKPSAFALHFPLRERDRSIVVIPDAMRFDSEDKSAHGWFFVADDGEDVCLMQIGAERKHLDDAYDIAKVVFGFSLYIEAFPETVVSAGAGQIHKVNHYDGGRHRVICNDVAKTENEHASTSPHFRRGHFRVLHSERFTKKQGQVVFVKGCFVRGKAYEVLSDAPPIEQKEAA